jgi:hypothetical protein
LIDLPGRQMKSGFHLSQILLPNVGRRRLGTHHRLALVAMAEGSYSDAAREQAQRQENCNPLITLHCSLRSPNTASWLMLRGILKGSAVDGFEIVRLFRGTVGKQSIRIAAEITWRGEQV